MADRAKLTREVKRLARYAGASRVVLPTSDGNLYEALIFLSVLSALRTARLNPTLHNPPGREVRLRGSPGGPGPSYSYVSFTGTSGQYYQVWNGIEVTGHSGMSHEVDVGVFQVSHPGPMASVTLAELAVAIECKCYSSATALKPHSRTNLGMVTDLSKATHRAGTGRYQGCIHCGKGFEAAFVSNVPTGARRDIQDYLQLYELNPQFGVLTGADRVRFEASLVPVLRAL